MLDMQLAIAKQRGLDLIGEAAADRAAARVPRFRAARRKQAQRDEISCARAAGRRARIA
ncbi:MAG: hypothetical protein ACRDWG_20375 [Actinomycetes bacterium]|jgi:hypothetical protein|nr:hypothetical protein [Actinomycetes bacterium]